MPNYGYHLARAEGNATRIAYRALLPSIARRRIPEGVHAGFDVFAYSGEKTLPEQVASIRSFLKYVGRPNRFTIVSDGTLSDRGCHILKSIDPVISVSHFAQWVPKNLPAKVYPYLTTHPTGKQLALIISLPVEAPALYVDSDVLFFPAARDLIRLAESGGAPAFYLADCRLSADERIFRGDAENAEPVNTGLLFLFEKLDWKLALRRFLELPGLPNFFTNQTMTHLTMHANGASPLDKGKYVLQLDDQFVYSDRYAGRGLALRHYVNPVRHKFWTAIARQGPW
ncbi:MAG TPA: hypothetical protein VNP98_09265 [Chthoniobacterales bacterium]|nr:hypothetical protein [Chthoniobacterales bacterium]